MHCYYWFVALLISSLSGNSLSLNTKAKLNKNDTDRDKINIKVFYESLCSGCRNEFTRTLVPLVKNLHDYINLEIIPFGNAKTLSQNKFQCQHGPAECYGNKLHACALFKLNNTLAVNYIACMMTEAQVAKMSYDEAALTCAKSRNIDSDAIRRCAMSDLGNLLHMEAGLVSSAVNPRYVPYVLVDGDPVTGDLVNAVCSSISQTASEPPACVWYKRHGLL